MLKVSHCIEKTLFFSLWAALCFCACSLSTPSRFSPDADSLPDDNGHDAATDTLPDSDPTDGADGADVPDAGPCDPNARWCNEDGNLQICNPEGTGSTIKECPFGCTEEPEPRCLELLPSNVDDTSLLCMEGTTSAPVSAEATYIVFDTDTGWVGQYDSEGEEILPIVRDAGEGLISGIHFTTRSQSGDARGLGIFSTKKLEVPAGMALLGWGENALVFFACEGVNVHGVLSASAIQSEDATGNTTFRAGPGGWSSAENRGPGGAQDGSTGPYSSGLSGGGGGGSFGGIGGTGGTEYSGGGGAVYGSDQLIPLYGGSGGGSGSDNYEGGYGYGGPGAGALQVSTPADITVHPGGAIIAGGLGGILSSPGGAGGGGGSGGGILLEAHEIAVFAGGIIAVNGGGGSSGALIDYNPPPPPDEHWGNYGEPGAASLDPAPGGESPVAGACAGGEGNSAELIDGAAAALCPEVNGGGGGGGAGRIRFNAMTHAIAPGTTSPSMDATPTTTTTGEPMVR